MNPDWQKYAERDAWLGAKKDLRKRRKRDRRTGGTQRPAAAGGRAARPAPRRRLVAAAVIVNQSRVSGQRRTRSCSSAFPRNELPGCR